MGRDASAQKKVLNLLMQNNGRGMNFNKIKSELGMKPRTLSCALRSLMKKGLIKKTLEGEGKVVRIVYKLTHEYLENYTRRTLLSILEQEHLCLGGPEPPILYWNLENYPDQVATLFKEIVEVCFATKLQGLWDTEMQECCARLVWLGSSCLSEYSGKSEESLLQDDLTIYFGYGLEAIKLEEVAKLRVINYLNGWLKFCIQKHPEFPDKEENLKFLEERKTTISTALERLEQVRFGFILSLGEQELSRTEKVIRTDRFEEWFKALKLGWLDHRTYLRRQINLICEIIRVLKKAQNLPGRYYSRKLDPAEIWTIEDIPQKDSLEFWSDLLQFLEKIPRTT
ncbi:MAG: helix-turn-helix transcriptional regulator [Candidatus Methanomethyliales bacterium]|nr:helix-turn-helix transcriptional regulator [Candidatus Methanomethylicales archaeon]